MNSVTVSVIIPIYNAEKHIEECLDSCLGQTLEQIEIICINDGSTDNTSKILERYAIEHFNIIILNQKNQGPGIARNLGIEHANGEFVAFMDSDDYYPDKDSLKKLYEAAVRENVLVCGGSALYVDNGKVDRNNVKWCFSENKIMRFVEYQIAFGYTRFIYNRHFLKKYEIKFPKYRRYQDPPFLADVMVRIDAFYVISDWIYAIRNTDKVVQYNNKDTLMDALNGIQDILRISRRNQFALLHSYTVLDLMERFIAYVYKLIYRGDTDVRECFENILMEIDKTLLEQDSKKIRMPELLSDEEIRQVVYCNLQREQELLNKINSYQILLIYGAGNIGRLFYSYLRQRGCDIDIEFIVSTEKPEGTSCGKPIHSIQEYIGFKNDALVVIANKHSAKQMEENARHFGFKHIEMISYDELILFGIDLTDGNYLTIY